MKYILIQSSKGFVSAVSTYSSSDDVVFVSDMHSNLDAKFFPGLKIISFKSFLFIIIKKLFIIDDLVFTESIFNFKSWFFIRICRIDNLTYLDNLRSQSCAWSDCSFQDYIYHYKLFSNFREFDAFRFIRTIKLFVFYPFLYLLGCRVIRLNNGAVGYRMICTASQLVYWNGSLPEKKFSDLHGLVILLPLINEPRAYEFYFYVQGLILKLKESTFASAHVSIYLKYHPRNSFCFDVLNSYDCFVLPNEIPLEFFDLKKSIILTHRSTASVSRCLGFFCLGKFLGLTDKDLIGVQATTISPDGFENFCLAHLEGSL